MRFLRRSGHFVYTVALGHFASPCRQHTSAQSHIRLTLFQHRYNGPFGGFVSTMSSKVPNGAGPDWGFLVGLRMFRVGLGVFGLVGAGEVFVVGFSVGLRVGFSVVLVVGCADLGEVG
jgi:hypothetical protein